MQNSTYFYEKKHLSDSSSSSPKIIASASASKPRIIANFPFSVPGTATSENGTVFESEEEIRRQVKTLLTGLLQESTARRIYEACENTAARQL